MHKKPDAGVVGAGAVGGGVGVVLGPGLRDVPLSVRQRGVQVDLVVARLDAQRSVGVHPGQEADVAHLARNT